MHLSIFQNYLDINWKDDGRCVTKIETETFMSSLIVRFWHSCVQTHKDHIIACCVAEVWTGTFPSTRLKSKDYTHLCDAFHLLLILNVVFCHKCNKIMFIFLLICVLFIVWSEWLWNWTVVVFDSHQNIGNVSLHNNAQNCSWSLTIYWISSVPWSLSLGIRATGPYRIQYASIWCRRFSIDDALPALLLQE